jgi:hypothetical protein
MLQLAGADLRVKAANADEAAIGIAQAFEDFDGGGLAGAVGAEQAEDFAFCDAEAHAAHGVHIAVVLDEIIYLQDGFEHDRQADSIP